ncbi:hypothetical protein [Haloarchaeobius sp. DT45]|uniref:hypothetical protein n=1 Tax=Haloarchaeobius sp. DT45 TaxID=3446116 RepID=UPI003F6A99B7
MHRRTLLSTVGSALSLSTAGCLSSFGSDSTGRSDPNATADGTTPDDATHTDTPTTGTPGEPTCETEYTAPEIADAPAFPAHLTEDEIAAYLEAVERTIVLPPESQISEGYVSIGTITVESVDQGYIATVPVTGGYYNEAGEGTATVHADLGTHTATYLVTGQVLKRAKAGGTATAVDPRESGTLLRCRPN